VHDRDLRHADRDLDREARTATQVALNRIVELCDDTASKA
jgi:hypothetical protein